MKRFHKLSALLAALLTVCLLFAACGGGGDPAASPSPSPGGTGGQTDALPENTNDNLKYFGYFHVDGFQGGAPFYDEIAALHNANVMMINSAWSVDQSLAALERVKAMGAKCFLSMPDFFNVGTVGEAGSATLKSDYEAAWNARRTAIASYIEDGTILGFYFDEPAWNGVSETDFRTVTKLLREQYPNVKLMNCMTVYDLGISKKENYPELNASYNEYCTDVMYDSYVDWNDEIRLDYLQKLKSKATNDQYLWACPKGFSVNPEQTEQMEKHIKGFYRQAVNEPRYAGIISFSYADGINADWGYGLHTFFDEDSEYYNRELRELYVDIGREVIGLEPVDHSKEVQLTVIKPQEVYELGEEIPLPQAGAVDGKGNVLDVRYEVTDPRGGSVPADGSFVGLYSGKYQVKVTGGTGETERQKTVGVYVRYPGEISTFDSDAYNADATGTKDDIWCWPRSVTNDVKLEGDGSLFVNTHPTDGTWPRIIFARNGYQLWDMTDWDAISCWIYNPSDEPIVGLSYLITDETEDNDLKVFAGKDIPAKQWTELTVTKQFITQNKPDLDITKLKILLVQSGATYSNRTPFYVDNVMFTRNAYSYGFENDYGVNDVTGTEADVWCWPVSVSAEQAHGGSKSLKVTPHPTDGTWPNVVFSSGLHATFDLTEADAVSVWVYSGSDAAIEGFGLKINNGENVNQAVKTFALPAKQWTEFVITKAEILEKAAGIDLTQVRICFAQLGGTYTDRAAFYLDDFSVYQAEPDTDPAGTIRFEKETDAAKVTGSEDDLWAWITSISAEQAHGGSKSLKVSPRSDGGTWPNVVFKNGDGTAYDLTSMESVSVWVYNSSDTAIEGFGLKINNGENVNQAVKTFALPAKTWTEFVITKAEILEKAADIDLTQAVVKFSQLGSEYANRAPFYLDDFVITFAA